jgi:predicted ester cyclase
MPTASSRRTLHRLAAFALVALAAGPAVAAQGDDDATAMARAKPQELVVAGDITPAQRAAILEPIQALYGFWNNGSPALLQKALSPQFFDHALPPGRPQGPAGPAAASKGFLAAVPDLVVAVVQQLVVGDRVVSQVRLTGHFTGTLGSTKGTGQAIDFLAFDILRVKDGKVTDNWHVEDNLGFEQQAGLLPK